MPYLHWENEEQLVKRERIIKGGTGVESDEKLLRAYLSNPHPLHIRRTLDQYYYHTLQSTEKRDKDQVVSRYQKKRPDKPRVVTMVDQLWLWVLVAADGRADTVITCFPRRDVSPSSQDPDPHGLTDVLTKVMLHMLDEPSIVKTAYDLAGVIASTCSRTYLNPPSTGKIPQFSEIYEIAIGDVVSTFTPFLI